MKGFENAPSKKPRFLLCVALLQCSWDFIQDNFYYITVSLVTEISTHGTTLLSHGMLGF